MIILLLACILVVLLLWLIGTSRNVNLVAGAVMIALLLFFFLTGRGV